MPALRPSRQALQQEALTRAASGQSLTNWPAIIAGFAARGIPNATSGRGRTCSRTTPGGRWAGRCRRGEHGVKVVTFVAVRGKQDADGVATNDVDGTDKPKRRRVPPAVDRDRVPRVADETPSSPTARHDRPCRDAGLRTAGSRRAIPRRWDTDRAARSSRDSRHGAEGQRRQTGHSRGRAGTNERPIECRLHTAASVPNAGPHGREWPC